MGCSGYCNVFELLAQDQSEIKEENNGNLVLSEEKKDGLEIYNIKNISREEKLVCPLCKYRFTREENSEIYKYRNAYIYVVEWTNGYNDDIESLVVNIFPELSKLAEVIESNMNFIENNQYYKYRCKRTNREIYLYLYACKIDILRQYIIPKDARYQYSKWKNDSNLKATLLKERKEKENIDLIKKGIRNEWDNMVLKIDAPIYEEAVKWLSEIEKTPLYDLTAFEKGSASYALSLIDDVTRVYQSKLHVASLFKLRNYVAENYVFESERNAYWGMFVFTPIDNYMSKEEKIQLEAFMQKKLKEKNLC